MLQQRHRLVNVENEIAICVGAAYLDRFQVSQLQQITGENYENEMVEKFAGYGKSRALLS